MASHTEEAREHALTQLMHTYGDSIKRMCCVYLKDLGVAEDAAQETFIKAYTHIDQLIDGEIANERAWLSRIAINTCKDMKRGGWLRHVDASVTLEDLPIPVSPPSVEHIALTTAILQLPRKQMEVILLHCDQGMTVRETAQVLGITPPAVINRLKKAREQLRIALEGGADE